MAAEIGRNWEGKPSGPRLRSGHAPLSNKEQSACDDDILQFGSPRAGRGGGLRGFQGQVQGRLVGSAM